MLIGLALIAGCDQSQAVYTLYRASPGSDGERIHVATFDATHGEKYNQTNCEIARDLFAKQPGVVVRYWCERGRFR